MSHSPPSEHATPAADPLFLLVKNHQARIANLEEEGKKTFFKRATASASASALFLGLILTFASLHDVFFAKPKADRVSRISEFNSAVNAAAKVRQELTIQTLTQNQNPQMQYALLQTGTVQILNNVATARAILPEMTDNDIGVPQLIILIYESLSGADLESARIFVNRAVSLKNATPYLHSEAKRYDAKYLVATGNTAQAHQSYRDALDALGNTPGMAAARAALFEDQVSTEFAWGDCESAADDLNRFRTLLPELSSQTRAQLTAALTGELRQSQGVRCTLPEATLSLLVQ
jgi:hypothetical protein